MIRNAILIVALFCMNSLAAEVKNAGRIYTLENDFMSRTISFENGKLSTLRFVNRLTGDTLVPLECEEFSLRISKGTDCPGTARVLTSRDFDVKNVKEALDGDVKELQVVLENADEGMSVNVYYSISPANRYMRKRLVVSSDHPVVIEKIDVESIAFADACQNYRLKEINARKSGGWKPGLGQPVYTDSTATFWGMEFPAANNTVDSCGTIRCGYLKGIELLPDCPYTSYNSVVGVADDKEFIDDAFYAYISEIRLRPLRLQIQYNSWFDYGRRVSKELFSKSVKRVHEELVEKRGCVPLNAYVIDDGWEDVGENADWTDTVWKINNKFTPYFSESRKTVANAGNSHLGIWLSPAVLFGSNKMVPRLGEEGYEALSYGMSMTGEKYMDKLEERVLDFAKHGISYFKFDGLFGHLNIRDFELNGRGTPSMPQLGTAGFSSNDERLNDSKYDELKTYYLVAGTERLMKIFSRLHEVNPEIFIAITNGAYLSPWWLSYVDIVWLINAGDAAKGKDRCDELVYRDHIYHQIWMQENTKFPMNSIFNHEPKKVNSGESSKDFSDYLLMNLSRGTGFIELYLKTDSLIESDWDVLAKGIKWAYNAFPAFKNVRMHGGNPKNAEVYGYTAWNERQGYISAHNPSDKPCRYSIVLDRKLGLPSKERKSYKVSCPLETDMSRFRTHYGYGDTITFEMAPKEIVVLDFD